MVIGRFYTAIIQRGQGRPPGPQALPPLDVKGECDINITQSGGNLATSLKNIKEIGSTEMM